MATEEEKEGPLVHFPDRSLFADVHTEGDAGVPYMGRRMLPNDGPPADAPVPAPVAGPLATSGRDDQERGETVSGLGTADVSETNEESSEEE